MTNGDHIRNMSDEALRDFLDKFRVETYTDPFGEANCKKCPTEIVIAEWMNGGKPFELHECAFVDGVCPRGDSLMWWLKQPTEEGNK